jgi:hypothetical protein
MDFPAPGRTGSRGQRGRLAVLVALAAAIVATIAPAARAALPTGVNCWGNSAVCGGILEKLPGPVHELSEVSAVSAGSEWGLALMNNTEKPSRLGATTAAATSATARPKQNPVRSWSTD